MSGIPSVIDLINANSKKTVETAKETAALTVKQQKHMETVGELTSVMLVGPNGTYIPAYFSQAENAFLPKFKV